MIVIFGADLLHEKSIGSLIYNARRCYLLVLSTGFVLEDGVECDGPTDRLTSTIFNERAHHEIRHRRFQLEGFCDGE